MALPPVDVLLLKLIPTHPVSAADFTASLQGLTINVFDLTVQDDKNGDQIGTATGTAVSALPAPEVTVQPGPPPKLDTAIMQDFTITTPPLSVPFLTLWSTATAVIVCNPPASHLEYPIQNSYDLKIQLQRGGVDIVDSTLEYNVTPQSVSLGPLQQQYLDLDVSVYVPLPPVEPSSFANLSLDPNGKPPRFDQVVAAVDLVLAKDHPTTDVGSSALKLRATPLTPPECTQIAAEIVWDRKLNPPPTNPDLSTLEGMYTIPTGAKSITDNDTNRNRQEFEGKLNGYRATLNANSLRMANFVYAASAAIFNERSSAAAVAAGLTFPIEKSSTLPSTPSVTPPNHSTAVLSWSLASGSPQATNPPFIVPAGYFYILGASLPTQMSPQQRYDAALQSSEDRVQSDLQAAVDAGLLSNADGIPITLTFAGDPINVNQAARRIAALGATLGAKFKVPLADPIKVLIDSSAGPKTGWLAYDGLTADIDESFWLPEISSQPAAYLALLLEVITGADSTLDQQIKTILNVSSVDQLVAVTDLQWRNFFLAHTDLLPAFTAPGNTTQRANAFVRHLRTFFEVSTAPNSLSPAGARTTPTWGAPTNDVFQLFLAEYNAITSTSYAFGSPLDPTAIESAVIAVFPNDTTAQAWLSQTVQTISTLFLVTNIGQVDLQFSLMEALYARGFTSTQHILSLSLNQFQAALAGTVAYSHAAAIQGAAGSAPSPPSTGPASIFAPVNANGLLTDCIPPPSLSPLGPVQYLYEMFQLTLSGSQTLGTVVSQRRGPIGTLSTTMANLETPLPLCDLVNESLEALGSDLTTRIGAIYDTNAQTLDQFILGEEPSSYDPTLIFASLPEHSSPASSIAKPAIYDTLKTCFTAADLPYPLALDICRSYLCHLGTSRFETMRHFRKDIWEFAIDPTLEPVDFPKALWRFPVRHELALEYLQISQDEYNSLYSGGFSESTLLDLLGIGAREGDRTQDSLTLPTFLKIVGLTYCEFLALWKSQYVPFAPRSPRRADAEAVREGDGTAMVFPDCEPCCLAKYNIYFGDVDNVTTLLQKLLLFIRLWRRLRELCGPDISFAQLAEICNVLGFFGTSSVNADFMRKLASLLLLRDHFSIPLSEVKYVPTSSATGSTGPLTPPAAGKRTPILGLWLDPKDAPVEYDSAVQILLESIEQYAVRRLRCRPRGPTFRKLLAANLDQLSFLVGFTELDTWHAHPPSTIRFVEVLCKIYASHFTVGEIFFLFTVSPHLGGDDPFALPDPLECIDRPLDLPDDNCHSLRDLRRKLLGFEIDDNEVDSWTWWRIQSCLRDIGFTQSGLGPDPVQSMGEHFFPTVLEQQGYIVPRKNRQYRVDLASNATTANVWDAPPCGPFHYDSNKPEKLWVELPLRDEQVIEKLRNTRQLNSKEQYAVQSLYFAPRASLNPFLPIFSNASEAIRRLVQEPCEEKRFAYFQREFAIFSGRCKLIVEHLTRHVATATGRRNHDDKEACGLEERVLRSLLADENQPTASQAWETDSGTPPSSFIWDGPLSGSAIAALLGLIGTGIVEEVTTNGTEIFHDIRDETSGFGKPNNEWNVPFPTVVPSMSFQLTPAQLHYATVRNGLALHDSNGFELGGAQPFELAWSGVLLIDCDGHYCFSAGAPRPDGERPDFGDAEQKHWLVTLQRGQKTWTLLNHCWRAEEAPDAVSSPLWLRNGAYDIIVRFKQPQPTFADETNIHRQHSGFQIKYSGPDTGDCFTTIPRRQLFLAEQKGPLMISTEGNGPQAQYLNQRFTSSLRAIRRTYQRAFKSVLLAERFCLSARVIGCDGQSEIGFMLDHGSYFLGTSSYRASPLFISHRAYFNLNFLPVGDSYHAPAVGDDMRGQPSAKRQAALFDWWERLFDYCHMRDEVAECRAHPVWQLFVEAAQQQPPTPDQLVRYVGVDLSLSALALNYFAVPTYTVVSSDLVDDRWAVRVWQAGRWIRAIEKRFLTHHLNEAAPQLWASDDPGISTGASSGNQNLLRFVQDSCLREDQPRRYKDLKQINDGLRQRSRVGLLAFLCGMQRVPLTPLGTNLFAQTPRDLSDLLLQDVEASLHDRASRIEDAISATQTLVQRSRLGLEPTVVLDSSFVKSWERSYATFEIWQAFKRRQIYKENWIRWDELCNARRSEAFQLLESEIRRSTLTVPAPGDLVWFSSSQLPSQSLLNKLQVRESAKLDVIPSGTTSSAIQEGLNLLGTPEYDARPSWLAPITEAGNGGGDGDGGQGGGGGDGGEPNPSSTGGNSDQPRIKSLSASSAPALLNKPRDAQITPNSSDAGSTSARVLSQDSLDPPMAETLPLWVKAAIRLGTRFVRVAAALPPQGTCFRPFTDDNDSSCCNCRGVIHPPNVDEFYFWLEDCRRFEGSDVMVNANPLDKSTITQDATIGLLSGDPTSDWERPEKAPGLLNWDPAPMVHLRWCRVHLGKFEAPRRSDEGLSIDPNAATNAIPQLNFTGRLADSLHFTVSAAVKLVGSTDPAPAGFRYDMVPDSTTVVPQVFPEDPVNTSQYPKGLRAYPFFAFFRPGAPLIPTSNFSSATAIAAALRSHCQFGTALKWYELIFNPLQRYNAWLQCDSASQARMGRFYSGGTRDLPCCASEPATLDIVRARAVLLDYLETLLEWGDAEMIKNSKEAIEQARIIFDVVDKILGPTPSRLHAHDQVKASMTVDGFVASPPPLNPRLLGLYEQRNDRHTLIQLCLNRRRQRNDGHLPYWGSPSTWDGQASLESRCDSLQNCRPTCQPYRFTSMMPRAMELASEVRSLGNELLSAYERGDAQYLACIRQSQEHQLMELDQLSRKNQWRESDWTLQGLGKTLEGAQTRLRYYQGLLQNGLIGGETGYVVSTGISMQTRSAGNVSEGISQGMTNVPDMNLGTAGAYSTPVNVNQLPVGNKQASGFATAARILNAVSDTSNTNGSLLLTQAGWDRRAQEWTLQTDTISLEIEQIQRQILAAERRSEISLRDLNNHQRQVEHSTEIQDFMRDQFATQDLYLFLQQETAALYHQTYELAMHVALETQRAFWYERRDVQRSFLPEGKWSSMYEGLMSGERLSLALQSMQSAYMDANCREYELTKHFSFRLVFPEALLRLKTTGYCEIDIPEWMFDLDFPGHYMRRVRNVSLTVPCIAGPYTGVHCRLQMLNASTRVDARLGDPIKSCCSDRKGHCCPEIRKCHCKREPELHKQYGTYRAEPEDPRVIRQYMAVEGIATSMGQNDSGLFELNFRDDRYLPFEFAGAVSRWRIELPPENNQFDFETISDVILHLNYTAREGGEALRRAANDEAQKILPCAGIRYFDVRHDLPDAWRVFRHDDVPPAVEHREFPLRFSRSMFPFVFGRKEIFINSLELFVEADYAESGEHIRVLFDRAKCGCKTNGRGCCGGGEGAADPDEDGKREIDCVVAAEWPGLYHGILDVDLGPVPGTHSPPRAGLGTLRFPKKLCGVRAVYLLCRYRVCAPEKPREEDCDCHGEARHPPHKDWKENWEESHPTLGGKGKEKMGWWVRN